MFGLNKTNPELKCVWQAFVATTASGFSVYSNIEQESQENGCREMKMSVSTSKTRSYSTRVHASIFDATMASSERLNRSDRLGAEEPVLAAAQLGRQHIDKLGGIRVVHEHKRPCGGREAGPLLCSTQSLVLVAHAHDPHRKSPREIPSRARVRHIGWHELQRCFWVHSLRRHPMKDRSSVDQETRDSAGTLCYGCSASGFLADGWYV
eukprot:scaffold5905_cov132-Isochrysis_galbana.AAC.9